MGLSILMRMGCAGCALSLVSMPVRGADALAMQDVARQVVMTNPRIDAQRKVVDQLKARLTAARRGYLPSIEANGIAQRRKLTIVGAAGDQNFTVEEATVEARLPILDFGRTQAAIRTAEAELANGEATLDGIIDDVLTDLLTAAADLESARTIRDFTQQQRDAIAAELKGTSRQLELREATLTDVDQAKARLASSEAALLDASEQVSAASTRYRTVAGAPGESAPPLPTLTNGQPSLDDALSQALRESSVVRAAQMALQAGQHGVAAAKAELAPSLEAVAGYDYLSGGVANVFTGKLPNDRSSAYAGVSVRVPLFQRGIEYADISRARALAGQRQFQLDEAEREVTRDVTLAWTRTRTAHTITLAAIDAVAANEHALAGFRRDLELRSRSVLDVLNAERDFLDARITEQRARRSEFLAQATLLKATGQLQPIILKSAP